MTLAILPLPLLPLPRITPWLNSLQHDPTAPGMYRCRWPGNSESACTLYWDGDDWNMVDKETGEIKPFTQRGTTWQLEWTPHDVRILSIPR